jgi:hypothetical protein
MMTAVLLVSPLLAFSLGAEAAIADEAGAGGQGAADLAIIVRPSAAHPRAHGTVIFSITVTNRGSGVASGLRVSLRTFGGMSHPELKESSPSTFVVGCEPTTSLGEPPECSARSTPPACQASATTLMCSYAHFSLGAPGEADNSLSIEVSAETGSGGREGAIASASASSTAV